jgi:RimJ/RimL family protein N-acetyltransferase
MKPAVHLRDVEPDDLPIFFEHQRDPVAVAMVVFRSRDKTEFDEHWAKILADDACLKKTIVADGQVAGNIGSFGRDGKREVGYWIDRTLWGVALPAQRSLRFSAWNRAGHCTPV